MKKIILTAALAAASVAAFGQGFVNFGSQFSGSFLQPIFSPNPASPGVEQMGNPGGFTGVLPSGGSNTFGGSILGSPGFQTGYDIQLYGGAAGVTSLSAMTAYGTAALKTATGNKLPAGLANPSTVQIGTTGALGGTPYNFYVVAFSTEGGTVSTYAQALANFNSGDANAEIGQSSLFSLSLGGVDSATGNTDLNPNTTGWVSFSLYVAPEPSTIALAGLGAAG